MIHVAHSSVHIFLLPSTYPAGTTCRIPPRPSRPVMPLPPLLDEQKARPLKTVRVPTAQQPFIFPSDAVRSGCCSKQS
ncbi:hypothetical protein BD309DRAFT_950010 [Dichomitus squalens]|nr:hypothetical protein BD309DRAFT_950010 [Dichomitus squalens]